MNILDKIHLQKYIVLLEDFIEDNITADEFERIFLQVRRQDNYLFEGNFEKNIEKILSILMSTVDSYSSDSHDAEFGNINTQELKIRAKSILNELKKSNQ